MSTVYEDHHVIEPMMRNAPSWAVSLSVHLCLVLILVQIPFFNPSNKMPTISVALAAPIIPDIP